MDYMTLNYTNCCRFCGKNYKKKTNLEKHVLLCEFIRKSSTYPTMKEEEEEPPSQAKMYRILLELGHKYAKLEQRLNEIDKWVVKKKKKVNVVEWLNSNIVPDGKFSMLNECVHLEDEADIQYLFKHSFAETLDHIFSRSIYNDDHEHKYPLFSFAQSNHKFYMFETEWVECRKEDLCKFLNKVHLKLHRAFMYWKKARSSQIETDEDLAMLCDKTSIKLLSVDFRQDSIFNKIKGNMYSAMKKDVQGLVEFEFEF